MNLEQVLKEVATAIKHRCISTSECWYVIYYRDRICCVPTYENVPTKIILARFTEQEVQGGFVLQKWSDLKTVITKLYKELHK